MLNSQADDCGNENAGGSFIALHTKSHLPILFVLVGLFPDMPVDYDHGHPPIDSPNITFPAQSMANSTEFGFDFDFNEFDFTNMDNFDFENMDVDALGLDSLDVSTTIDYEHAFMEAALSIAVQENRSDYFQADSSQLVLPPYPSHPNTDTISSIGTSAGLSSPVLSSTSGVLSAPTLPEPDGIHAHRRRTKRRKVDEVDAAHILPEGLQRSRTKSAKATAALEST